VKRWLERRHGEATEELLLAIAIEDWERIETVRQKRDAAVIPVTAHALSRGDEESACGLRARQASPTTRWADPWLEDEWGPIVRCPNCQRVASS
jgi:hypothetical protein